MTRMVVDISSAPAMFQATIATRAHGVVVSHPLRMRKAPGSNASVSITCEVPFHVSDCPDSELRSVHH